MSYWEKFTWSDRSYEFPSVNSKQRILWNALKVPRFVPVSEMICFSAAPLRKSLRQKISSISEVGEAKNWRFIVKLPC